MRVLAVVALMVVMLAGCVSDVPSEPASHAENNAIIHPPVVAILDSGIDPYHLAFRGQGWAPTGTPALSLSDQGDWRDRRSTDDTLWSGLQAGQLYRFEGTRVLAVSFTSDRAPLILDANGGHGTTVAAKVLEASSEATVVVVQVSTGPCPVRGDASCLMDASVAAGLQWAAEQEWIDVISMSFSLVGNLPDSRAGFDDVDRFLAASRAAHDAGKLIVASSGNEAAPPALNSVAGPPWVIAAGGVEGDQKGEAPLAGRAVDVVSNYTFHAPRAGTVDAYSWVGGTSYAAPYVAGVLAQAKHDLGSRQQPTDSVTLRSALNASAAVWAPTDWNPTARDNRDMPVFLSSRSIPIIAPGAQGGWGYVGLDTAAEMVSRVEGSDLSTKHKATVASAQEVYQGIRKAYWES